MVEIDRRTFLFGTGATLALVLTGCGFGDKDKTPNLESAREPWETDEVVAMGLALSGISEPEASEYFANGFRVKEQIQLSIAAGEKTEEGLWWLVKNPSGKTGSSVWYSPEKNTWLKVMQESNAHTLFDNSIEAMRASARVSGLSPDIVKEVQVLANGNSFRAMEVQHLGPTIQTLLDSGRLTKAQASTLYEGAYANAIRIAEEGFIFRDPNLNNVVVQLDDIGEIKGVINIDFTNKGTRLNRPVNALIRERLAADFTKQAEIHGLTFDVRRAESILSQDEMAALSKVEDSIDLLQYADDGTLQVVETIKAVDQASDALVIADDVVAAEQLSAIGNSRIVRLLRNPKLISAGRTAGKVLKFAGDVGLLFMAADLLDGPNKETLSREHFRLQNGKTEYLLQPDDIWNFVEAHKDKHRVWELPGYDGLKEEGLNDYQELMSLGLTDDEISNVLTRKMLGWRDRHTLPVKLMASGPGIRDQARDTGINMSAIKEDTQRSVILWNEIDGQPDIVSVMREAGGNWQPVFNSGNPTIRIPGTMSTINELSGYIIAKEQNIQIVLPAMSNG